MIGLDTNVLVRYLTQDDAEQSAQAVALIEGAASRGERLFISQIVLCEVVWVLRSAFRTARDELISVLEAIVATSQFVIQDAAVTRRALERFKAGDADFADYVMGENALAAGCKRVLTFDRKLLREPEFSSP